MGLQSYELDLVRMQLGYAVEHLGAEPYIGYLALFDKVVQPYLFDNTTTSSTAVVAAGTLAVTVTANPVAPNNAALLTFNMGTSCVVDVGPNQEIATIQVLSGLTWTITFASVHPAGFTIWPNGAEWAVRGILTRIATIESAMNTISPRLAGLAQVDEIKAYASSKGSGKGATKDPFDSLVVQRAQARNDLAGALGVPNLWEMKRGGSSRVEPY